NRGCRIESCRIFWRLAPANTGLVLTEAWCDSIPVLLQIAGSSLPTSWSKRRRCLRSCGHQTRQPPHRQLPRCLRIATAHSGAVRSKDFTALSAKAHTLCRVRSTSVFLCHAPKVETYPVPSNTLTARPL